MDARVLRDLRFFLERRDRPDPRDPRSRMHCRQFWADRDGTAATYDGSPPWTRWFAHWLGNSSRATRVETIPVQCFHVGRPPGADCEVCGESGVRLSEQLLYRYPARATMARLQYRPRDGFPLHSEVLSCLAYARGDMSAAASILARRYAVMGDDQTALRAFADALNRFRRAWREEPLHRFAPAAAGEDAA